MSIALWPPTCWTGTSFSGTGPQDCKNVNQSHCRLTPSGTKWCHVAVVNIHDCHLAPHLMPFGVSIRLRLIEGLGNLEGCQIWRDHTQQQSSDGAQLLAFLLANRLGKLQKDTKLAAQGCYRSGLMAGWPATLAVFVCCVMAFSKPFASQYLTRTVLALGYRA